MSPNNFYKAYLDKGFFFKKELLTRYCLSLYTKPFVILSGISGTGKTKIAQLFNLFIEEENQQEKRQEVKSPASSDHYLLLNVTEGIVNGDGRGNLKYSDNEAIFDHDELEEIERKIEDLRKRKVDDNITDTIPIEIIDSKANEILKAGVYLQRASSPLLRVRFKSKAGEKPPYDHRPYFQKHHKVGDVLKLKKIGSRKYEIAEKNSEQYIKEVEEFEAEQEKLVNNLCFVSVKSNWTDTSEIFGYFNPIEDTYYVSKTLRFFLAALEYPNKPFFLILDEMNLSKVENYFSDFLSCLESRYLSDGVIKQEAITLHSSDKPLSTDDSYYDSIPPTIEIPLNLFVTGTINVDETTYMFSPKVLDRANVIEFNQVDFENYQNNTLPQEEKFVFKELPQFITSSLATQKDFHELSEDVRRIFIDLNKVLEKSNQQFGYRVINEISLFIKNTIRFIGTDQEIINKAIDFQISQKILPKFHGSIGKLEVPLNDLLVFLLKREAKSVIAVEEIEQINENESDYPVSIRKLKQMYSNVYKNGFASFIE